MQVETEILTNMKVEVFPTNKLLPDGRAKTWILINGLKYLGFLRTSMDHHQIFIPELGETLIYVDPTIKQIKAQGH